MITPSIPASTTFFCTCFCEDGRAARAERAGRVGNLVRFDVLADDHGEVRRGLQRRFFAARSSPRAANASSLPGNSSMGAVMLRGSAHRAAIHEGRLLAEPADQERNVVAIAGIGDRRSVLDRIYRSQLTTKRNGLRLKR